MVGRIVNNNDNAHNKSYDIALKYFEQIKIGRAHV